ncbi:PIR Superfamily Protein [Plasmodium ovale wallikeri]|uniref:PIR Superfamily Protein n=1 Tax=Plasmodium ovale wallikeri TaxID=864142 RepID=A0A1A8YPI7_PLAOA|nr:PIR Superfamily Protein [Plasmodium ovale wallikeri]
MENIAIDIPNLPSIKNYDILDSSYSEHGDISKCNKLQHDLEQYQGIKKFCLNFTGIFSQINNLSLFGPFDSDHCTIVKYWMYDRLFNEILKENIHGNIASIIGKLIPIWKHYDKDAKCDIISNSTVKDDFNKMKKLYDYITNYTTIHMYLMKKSFKCNEYYRKYSDEINLLYNQIKSNCLTSNHINCYMFKIIEKTYNSQNVKELRCDKVLTNTVNSSDQIEMSGSLPPGRENVIDSESRRSLLAGSPDIRGVSSQSVSDIVIILVFPLFSILIIIFILYKFTPFGPWFRNHLIRKKISEHNIYNEETNESLENTYEYLNTRYNDPQHNIGFNPL